MLFFKYGFLPFSLFWSTFVSLKLHNRYYHIPYIDNIILFIGKERIFTAIAQEIKAKIWGSTEKVRVLKTLSDPIIDSNLTKISCDAQIHVVEMHKVHSVRFHEI